MPPLRAGIIGLAWIAANPPDPAPAVALGVRHPYSHAAAYDQLPETEVVAICDVLPATRDAFVARWATRWPRLRAYDDYRRMLADADLDLVSICTPDHLHADMVVAACEAGVRGIVLEKPLATTIRDADRILAAAERYGVRLSVEHTRRWVYEYQAMRRLIREGTIGRVTRINATLNGERAMLFRNGTHIIDLITFFADSDPVWVMAALDEDFDAYPPRYAGDGGRDPKTDPGALGIIAFANGVRAVYQGSQGTQAQTSIEVIGEQGWIHAGISTHDFRVHLPGPEGSYDTVSRSLPRHATTRGGVLGAVGEMVDLITVGGETLSPARDARRSVEIMLGFLQSHRRDGARVYMPVQDE